MTKMRPMLAAQKYRSAGDLWSPIHEKVVLAQLAGAGFLFMEPKIDGLRCCFDLGVARSRSWKPLGSKYLQAFAKDHEELMQGIDSEVVSGHVYSADTFRESMGGMRAEEGSPEFTLYMFDHFGKYGNYTYARRLAVCQSLEQRYPLIQGSSGYSAKLIACPVTQVSTLEDIYAEEERLVANGWEGGILRHPAKPYKFGRATALGGELVKLKRRDTVDAIVTGYEPWMENQNEATESALGYTVRSSHKDGKVELARLGALHVRRLDNDSAYKVGVMRNTTHGDRDKLWEQRDSLVGRYCELSVDKATGGYARDRTPVWLRWRSAVEF